MYSTNRKMQFIFVCECILMAVNYTEIRFSNKELINKILSADNILILCYIITVVLQGRLIF
jgi:hypothetical protein